MYDRHRQNKLLMLVLGCCAIVSVLIGIIATLAVQQDSPPVAQATQAITKPAPSPPRKTSQATPNYSSPPNKREPVNASNLLNPKHYHEILENYLAKYENDPSSVQIIEFTQLKQWTGSHVEAGVIYRAKNKFGVIETKTIRFMFDEGKITDIPIPGR